MQQNKRPVNLNFMTIHFPLTAWVSILHRISGIGIFLIMPFLLWVLQESLLSKERFLAVKKLLHQPFLVFILWGCLTFMVYHYVAGIRHLCLDLQIGISREGARRSAAKVMVITLILVGIIGSRLW